MANYRVRPKVASKTQPQNVYNALSEYMAWQAKSGGEAKLQAEVIESENRKARKQGKIKTVKVNSNPTAGKTRLGPLAGGAGGMFGIKNR